MKTINSKEIVVIIIAISGFSKGKEFIISKIDKLRYFDILICDPLSYSDKVFSGENGIFDSKGESLKAFDLATKYGELLEKQHPLGFNNSQALIVFEQSCPNNTLPILWKEKSNKWIPLFKRV